MQGRMKGHNQYIRLARTQALYISEHAYEAGRIIYFEDRSTNVHWWRYAVLHMPVQRGYLQKISAWHWDSGRMDTHGQETQQQHGPKTDALRKKIISV